VYEHFESCLGLGSRNDGNWHRYTLVLVVEASLVTHLLLVRVHSQSNWSGGMKLVYEVNVQLESELKQVVIAR